MEVIATNSLANPSSSRHLSNALYLAGTLLLLVLISCPLHAEVVNLNTADANTLQHYLFGIGVKKADAIVAYRDKNGPFNSVDDLTKVPGVGKGLLEKNRRNLSLTSGVSTVTLKPRAVPERKSAQGGTPARLSGTQTR